MEELFSLRWNNFHKNLSSGFQRLLLEDSLVDVTLATEGQFLQAHRLVLSVCSPYFKQLFAVNPCKHPIVILKDVQYKQLSDILTFMYQGEVNVHQDNLAEFLKTAELLQVRGLAEQASACEDSLMSPMQSMKNAHLSTTELSNDGKDAETEERDQNSQSEKYEPSPSECTPLITGVFSKKEPSFCPDESYTHDSESRCSQGQSSHEISQRSMDIKPDGENQPTEQNNSFGFQSLPFAFSASHLLADDSSQGSKKRVLLDLDTKMKVIEASEGEKLPVKDIMMKFNIGKSQVYDILKAKTEIQTRWRSCKNIATKRKVRKTGNEDINELVWEWFVSARSRNFRLSGAMVQDYARKVAERLGKSEFKASNGWLECFRKRHQIVFSDIFNGMADT